MKKYIYLITLFLSIIPFHNIQRVMEISDLFNLKLIRGLYIYPDEEALLLLISEKDLKNDKRVQHIWKSDFYGNIKQLVDIPHGESNPQFVCNDSIYFLSMNNGKQNIYAIDKNGKNLHLVFSHNSNITSFSYSKEKNVIYFLSSEKRKELIKDLDGNFIIGSDSIYPNNILMSYELKTGKKEVLSPDSLNVRYISISANSKSIALTLSPGSYPDYEIKTEIYLLNLESKEFKKLTNNNIIEKSISWSKDSKKIYFLSDANIKQEFYYQHKLFYIDVDSGKIGILDSNFNYEINSYFHKEGNNNFYSLVNMGVKQNLFYYTNDHWEQLTKFNAFIRFFAYDSKRDLIFCSISTADKTDDVYILNKKGEIVRQVTFINPFLNSFILSKSKIVKWPGNDEKKIEGILYFPTKYDSLKKYPLVIQLHGGPAASFTLQFPVDYNSFAHVLAGKGFFVFQPNYRGSTGYGDDWMREILGHFFEKDVDDVITGIKYLANEGLIDTNKIVIQGWSAGAHLTNWIITHFNYFKAASAYAGMCDWISLYNTSEIKYLREVWFKGTPKEKYRDFYDKSPINYVKNVKTPLLIFAGELDRRIPIEQAKCFYDSLVKEGVKTELVIFPENGHGIWQLSKQQIKMEKELKWFLSNIDE